MLTDTYSLNSLTELDFEAEDLRRDFYSFVKAAWHVVENDKYVDNWHIKAICTYLQALYEGRIPSRNLMINVPPGHTKSLLVNVFYVAWCFAKDDGLRFLCYSYSSDLTVRDNMKCRKLVGSDWYQRRFHVQINPNDDLKDGFSTESGGYRKCFGMTSSIGGWRGDFILIDDPLEMTKAESEAERNKVNNAYDSGISSRETDPATTKRVIIMQRLHEDDLCGHLLESEEWEQLVLPAEYDAERFVSSIGFEDTRHVGQLLWPERFTPSFLAIKKKVLGERAYAGQYQQRPSPLAGNIFKREWFKDRMSELQVAGYYVSGDTATSMLGARSALVVVGITNDFRLVPVFVWADNVEFPDLVEKIVEVAKMFPEHMLFDIVIEGKSSGEPAIQTISQKAPEWIASRIHSYYPTKSKEARASVASVWCENGSVVLPTHTDDRGWLLRFEEELFNFPNGKYKDQVDSFVQAILWCENILSDGLHSRLGANL